MGSKMLIDASHPEETRVVVLKGNRIEEFDFESAARRQLKGNIYLAKVTRVEPSLQAAFVEYGGNRQGFLAFAEIHPDYYQIPAADRAALIAEQEAEARRRWPLDETLIVHRHGRMEPGEDIVLVIAASAHRGAAFEACRFLIGSRDVVDALKSGVAPGQIEERIRQQVQDFEQRRRPFLLY